MTIRSMESRLAKLETLGGRSDKFLVVWRLPDGDVAEAAATADFARGDRVVCFEWFGEEPMPVPCWHDNLRGDFSDEQQSYVSRSIERYLENGCAIAGIRPPPYVNPGSLTSMKDGELYHSILGVET